jgi:cell wall-associated NlpC family hydrolase
LLAATALVLSTTAGTVALTSLRPASADVAADIATSQAQLDQLNAQAEAASERFNKGRIDLEAAQRSADTAQAALAQQDVEVATLRTQIGAFAAQAYRTGGPVSQLGLWTSQGSAQAILNGLSMLDVVAQRQSDAMAALNAARARQQIAATAAKAAAGQAATVLAALDADRQGVVDAATRGQQVLAALQAQQAQLVAAARDAAARQAAQQAAASLAAQAAGASTSLAAFRAQGSQPTAPAAPAAPAAIGAASSGSQAATVAVRTALGQLGKPYVFGAAGPGSFDCSGLTMFAYAAAGISLPHYTGSQYATGRRVGLGELQPGDLVFFDGLGHEGMYIGNGMMVHAPHSGDVVRTVAIAGYWQSVFVGAVRVTG